MPISSVARGPVLSEDPVKQIRNLIKDLDAELLQLTTGPQRARAIPKAQPQKRGRPIPQIPTKTTPNQTLNRPKNTKASPSGVSMLQELIKASNSKQPQQQQQPAKAKQKSYPNLLKSYSQSNAKGPSVNASRSILGQTKPTVSKHSLNGRSGRLANLNMQIRIPFQQQLNFNKTSNTNITKTPSMNLIRTFLGQPKPAGAKPVPVNKSRNVHRVNISKTIMIPAHRTSSKQSLLKPNQYMIPLNMKPRSYRALLNSLRARVVEAYRNRKIFTVFGNYFTIRKCLLNRGWIEKLPPGRLAKYQHLPEEQLLAVAKPGNDFEAVLLSRLANDFPAFFVWQGRGQRDIYADVLPYRNRIRRGRTLDFSTKIGLVGCTLHEHWYNQGELSHMCYPRLYRLSQNVEEQVAFIEDFRLTQCRSLVRFVHERINNCNVMADEKHGTVDINILNFALEKIKSKLKDKENQGIDNVVDTSDRSPETWRNFMINSKLILNSSGKFKAKASTLIELDKSAAAVLEEVYQKNPEFKWDGVRNLWILKPGYAARGIGIQIRSNVDEILNIAKFSPQRYYIAQKYIERPLLIYKTKFDIRQYLLVVINDVTVTLWLYKDCYFRFSSQEYNMEDLRESIHITNNCVQRKYRNKVDRDTRLPVSNMWCLAEFQKYLKMQNKPENFWNNQVFKGMKANLTAIVMASMEDTNFIPNSFEMYGCDFMLDEDYHPILIEINATPDLSPSTLVTKYLCPNALRDVIKVVVDLPRNPNAPTGNFEKIYTINYRTNQSFDPKVGLVCAGKQMTLQNIKESQVKLKAQKSMQMEVSRHQTETEQALAKSPTNKEDLGKSNQDTKNTLKKNLSVKTVQDQPMKSNKRVIAKVAKTSIREPVPEKPVTKIQSFALDIPKSANPEATKQSAENSTKIQNDKDTIVKKVSFKNKIMRSIRKLKCPLKKTRKILMTEANVTNVDMKPIVKNKLRSLTREALALQYTQPS